jgi:hypothetical protein
MRLTPFDWAQDRLRQAQSEWINEKVRNATGGAAFVAARRKRMT